MDTQLLINIIVTIVNLIGLFMIVQRKWLGWVLFGVSEAIWLVFAVMDQDWWWLVGQIGYVAVAGYGVYLWRRSTVTAPVAGASARH